MSQFGNYFSDPAEMEKYKEKVRLYNKYKDILPDANLYPHDLYEVHSGYIGWDKDILKYIRFKRINVNSPNGIFKQWEADI